MPSAKSGVPAQAAKLAASASSCSESERPRDSRIRRFALRIASVGPSTSDCTSAATVASTSASGHDAIDESPRERLLRVEALGEQHDLHRAAHARRGAAAPRSRRRRR